MKKTKIAVLLFVVTILSGMQTGLTYAAEPATEAVEESSTESVAATEAASESSTESQTEQEMVQAAGISAVAATGAEQNVTETEQTVPTETEKASETEPETQVTAVVPVKVTSLKASVRKANAITLKWKSQDSTIHYLVYQYDTKKKTYKKVGVATKNYYTVKSLKSGTQYKFLIQAFNPQNVKAKSVTIKASTIVAKVTGVSTKSATTSSVTLKWKKTADISGYVVYRYDSAKKKYVKQATVKKTGTSFTAKKLSAGKSYKYQIRTYKTVNGKKVYSGAVTYTAVTKPAKVKISSLTQDTIEYRTDKGFLSYYAVITLKWNKVSGATGYQVYLYDNTAGKYEKVSDTKGTSYKPKDIASYQMYKYKVRAYKTVGGKKSYGSFSTSSATSTTDMGSKDDVKWLYSWNGYSYADLDDISSTWLSGDITKGEALKELKEKFPKIKTWTFKKYPDSKYAEGLKEQASIDYTRYFVDGYGSVGNGYWGFIYGK